MQVQKIHNEYYILFDDGCKPLNLPSFHSQLEANEWLISVSLKLEGLALKFKCECENQEEQRGSTTIKPTLTPKWSYK